MAHLPLSESTAPLGNLDMDEVVQYGGDEQSNEEERRDTQGDVSVTMPPQDYTDALVAKHSTDSGQKPNQSQAYDGGQKAAQAPAKPPAMKRIENKLKRLADLGDINANKQT